MLSRRANRNFHQLLKLLSSVWDVNYIHLEIDSNIRCNFVRLSTKELSWLDFSRRKISADILSYYYIILVAYRVLWLRYVTIQYSQRNTGLNFKIETVRIQKFLIAVRIIFTKTWELISLHLQGEYKDCIGYCNPNKHIICTKRATESFNCFKNYYTMTNFINDK